MKTTILKSVFFAALTAGILTGCVNDDEYGVPELGCTETTLVKNKEVADIAVTETLTQHTDDDIIEAYVTSSDEGGNFFKTISFQTLDGSQAFSVAVDATSTFVNFEPGRRVLIKMKDLYKQIDNGKVFGGVFINDSGEASVGRLPESQFKAALNRSCQIVDEDVLVQQVSLLNLADDFYLNKLVEVTNVQFADGSAGQTYYESTNDIGGATNHYITDAFGNQIVFRTSSFANFAGRITPMGSGTIRGVLTKFGDTYQFIARTERDVMLTNPRFDMADPFYIEDFQTAQDNTTLNIPGWLNFAEVGTKQWKEEAFSGNGYAEFSAFGSGNAINVAWLISPAIDVTAFTEKQLQFKLAQHHLDVDSPENGLEVLISTDFDGTNVLAATWTAVPANVPTTEVDWYEFVTSVIDISSFNGTIHVAFRFTGSGTNTALDGAFQVDDVKVFGQ